MAVAAHGSIADTTRTTVHAVVVVKAVLPRGLGVARDGPPSETVRWFYKTPMDHPGRYKVTGRWSSGVTV